MKTNYLSGRKLSIYTLFGLVGLLASSCGSYQNSSYYDNDGVYGSDRPRTETVNKYSEENMAQANKYKEFFGSYRDEYPENNEVFTDVEGYTSQNNDSTKVANKSYAGWGENSDNVTINVYSNDYWGGWYTPYWGWNSWYSPRWSWGWGWNSYYGSYWNVGWGWNYPYYGWGWYSPYYYGYYGPGWSWYNHYHGYYRDVAYNGGTRGRYYNGNGNYYRNAGNGRSSAIGAPRSAQPRSTFANPRSSQYQNDTPRPTFSNPRGSEGNQGSGSPRINTPRSNEPKSTPRTYSEPRSSSPRSYSEPRSSSPRSYSAPSSGGYSSPRSSGSSGGGSYGGGRSGGRR
ncbi:hypothetical protein [Flavobacterium suncheonense]|nr:hypothetical protein [Flavobacterium suncheonense]